MCQIITGPALDFACVFFVFFFSWAFRTDILKSAVDCLCLIASKVLWTYGNHQIQCLYYNKNKMKNKVNKIKDSGMK